MAKEKITRAEVCKALEETGRFMRIAGEPYYIMYFDGKRYSDPDTGALVDLVHKEVNTG